MWNYVYVISFSVLFINCIIAYSQHVAINTYGSVADSSAILDIRSTTQGMLLPRLTTAERDAIGSPAIGLVIYNTDADGSFQNKNYEAAWWYLSEVSSSHGLTLDLRYNQGNIEINNEEKQCGFSIRC